MWDQGGQPWPQWPLSQQQWMQSFQHQQDPSQVDWAALAQAWIAQKDSTGTEVQNMIQPNGQEVPGIDPVPQGNHGPPFPSNQSFGRMWQPVSRIPVRPTPPLLSCPSFPEWGMQGQPPPPPPPPDQVWIPPGSGPMEVVNPSEDSNSQDSLEFSSEARHGVYPQNSHGMGLHLPSAPRLQASMLPTGRVLPRTGETTDPLASERGQGPPSSLPSSKRPQQHWQRQ
ncbi:arginine/serine-rich protein PNISR isoform X3 [Gadus macrocephalus]|uniref:arginine/serine-rich protein PNISR isoform X3 n=1 Tax=Gadus macrocephalus TaxID=80720 RepID=UPI0028CB5F1B|nr:arginine/serine-rich protein PNISR isoform X3 [Gadus macrocephalus]